MDRIDAMAVVVKSAELSSFSAAARALRMPLTTVSRRVADLEAHLKTRLFTRTSRKVTLTQAGEAYLVAARRILEEVELAERAAAGEYLEPKGQLIITAPIVFGRLHVLPILTEFLEQFREVSVQLSLADGVVNLVEDRVDLAVRIGALPDSSLRAAHIGSIRQVTCASPAYFEKRPRPRKPSDLAVHDWVSRAGQTWRFQVNGREVLVPLRTRLQVNTAEAAIDAVRAGLGLTRLLSYQVAAAVQAGELEVVLPAFEPAPMPLNLVYAGDGPLAVKLRACLDFMLPRLKARMQALEVLTGRSAASRRPRGE